jgi:Cdc6-like AAA superfamily ATPase
MKLLTTTSIAEKIGNEIILHNAYANVVNGCIKVIDAGMRTNRPNKGMIIMGHGGTGKTTAIHQIQGYVAAKYSGKFNTPVLILKISSDTTVKSFYLDILGALNHPISHSRQDRHLTVARLKILVTGALKGNVCILFIDEVSDIFSNRLKSFPFDFLGMIKHLASDTSINIILVGTLALIRLMEIADYQFLTRFPTTFKLPLFKNDKEWVLLLKGYILKAKNIFDLEVLGPMYHELYNWTGGNLRDLTSLLTTAIDIAEQEKVTSLTAEHLHQAQQYIFPSFKAA